MSPFEFLCAGVREGRDGVTGGRESLQKRDAMHVGIRIEPLLSLCPCRLHRVIPALPGAQDIHGHPAPPRSHPNGISGAR